MSFFLGIYVHPCYESFVAVVVEYDVLMSLSIGEQLEQFAVCGRPVSYQRTVLLEDELFEVIIGECEQIVV